ncbi:MAG: hypothetical protein PHO62_08005 [Sulfurimonas sp.]|uniref:hypothetical protein n=1 Tax=Sulfurimonas sp. TaxID=2022749 RepID=UPI00260B2A80|nr:hypothetical protein [Sulfurimonas sp.]MDD5373351.1 hypothetical protein [Sulfurimonas sp.]
MPADMDWDKPDEELEEMIDDEDDGSVIDFDSLDENGGLNFKDDDDEDDGGLKLARPPSENAAMRMIETFTSVYDTATELAATMNVVITEARGVIALAKKSGADTKEISASYEAGVLKINKQLAAAQKYFELNKNIAKDLSLMKDELREEFEGLNSSLESAYEKYIGDISAALEGLSFKLQNFSQNIDLSGFEKVVKAEIEKVIKSSTLNRVEAAFDRIDKSFFLLEDGVTRLAGLDNKKGLLEEFKEEVYSLEEKLKKIKARSSFLTLISSFFLGGALVGGGVWVALSFSFDNRMSHLLSEHTVNLNEAFLEKMKDNAAAHKGYDAFAKKYGLGGRFGFTYDDGSKKSYLYYPVDAKGSRDNSRVFIEME